MRYLLFFIGALILTSCAGNQDKKTSDQSSQTEQDRVLPSLPDERAQELYRQTISIDIIAYKMGISMSYNDPGSIQPVLAFLTRNPGSVSPSCKPVGRISFMTENGIGEEAEMYIHNGCRSFVWLDGGKETYSNELTHEGLDFFTRFIPENPADFKMPEGGTPSK